MITRWNSRVGTEYEVDPKGWAWAWISPDVMVDNDDDVMADTQVFFGQNNSSKFAFVIEVTKMQAMFKSTFGIKRPLHILVLRGFLSKM